jgi:large repetitive protein
MVDGTQIGADTTAPYESSWNTAMLPAGQHLLTADASDAVGTTTTSTPITATITA